MAKRTAKKTSKDLGTITISPCGELITGSRHTFTFTYTAGKKGIATGGGIRIIFPGSHSWTVPQVFSKSHYPGLATAMTDDGTCLVKVQNIRTGYNNDLGQVVTAEEFPKLNNSGTVAGISVTVVKGCLSPGGSIVITFGDIYRGKGYGAMVSHKFIPAKNNLDTFPTYVDLTGKGNFLEHPNPPEITVIPDKTVALEVHVPSLPGKTRNLKIHVKARDRFYNPTPDYKGRLSIKIPGAKQENRTFPAGKGAVNLSCRLPQKPGVYRVKVKGPGNLNAVSNPLIIAKKNDDLPYNIYWGELHHHTCYSDDNERGTRMRATPEETCSYARDISGLDFVAVTDHHNWYKSWYHKLIKKAWQQAHACAKKMSKKGEFIVFAGMEYRCDRGDTNVICKNIGEKYCPPEIGSIEKVWEFYKGRDVITIPHHHPQVGTKKMWSWRNDELERLVEICSNHGRYEFQGNVPRHPKFMDSPFNCIQYHLSQGKRYGITCGSDDHMGQPGNYQLTAVLAKNKTREAIFEALHARRCYGTTHARILIFFSVNGAMMGEEIKVSKGTDRCIKVQVYGTAPLLSVELIKNNKEVYSLYNQKRDVKFEYIDTKAVSPSSDWYYLRILQKDGDMAWTSPVWVDRG